MLISNHKGNNEVASRSTDAKTQSGKHAIQSPSTATSMYRYALSAAFGFVLNIGLTAFLHELLRVPERTAFAITLCVVFGVNFLLLRTYVFPGSTRRPSAQFGIVVLSSALFRAVEYAVFLVLMFSGVNYLLAIFSIQGTMFVFKHFYYKWVFLNGI